MGLHPDGFQGIEEKMGVDLAGHHFEFDLVLLQQDGIFLPVGFLNLTHQIIDVPHHMIELPGQLADFIFTVNDKRGPQIAGTDLGDMFA
ncbi:hypothetical protein D3C86_1763440 [compost metagenome]